MVSREIVVFLVTYSIFVYSQEDSPNGSSEIREASSRQLDGEEVRQPLEYPNQVKKSEKTAIGSLGSKTRGLQEIVTAKDEAPTHLDQRGQLLRNDLLEGALHDRDRRGIQPPMHRTGDSIDSNGGKNDCYLCPIGPPGPIGRPGHTGIPGMFGRTGLHGMPGPSGLSGALGLHGLPGIDGSDGVCGPCNDFIEASGTGLPTVSSSDGPQTTGGAVYTRWGRTTCPENTQLIYEGFGAGGYDDVQGGTSNFFCLPSVPQYGAKVAGRQDARSPLWKMEYERADFPGSELHNEDMPCAVCMATSRLRKLLVPARNTCPTSEWTLEYSGYLQSGKRDGFRVDSICLDDSPETMGEQQREEDRAAMLFPTEYRCFSRHCSNSSYTDGYELTCAVCTI